VQHDRLVELFGRLLRGRRTRESAGKRRERHRIQYTPRTNTAICLVHDASLQADDTRNASQPPAGRVSLAATNLASSSQTG
jgi:hypothetical protein